MKKKKIQNKIYLFLIILVTILAVGARIVGLSYDNLISYNHDERIHLLAAEEIFSGNLNPRDIWEGRKFLYIFYPWLSMYIVAGVYYIYDLILSWYSFIASWLIFIAGGGGSFLQKYSFKYQWLDKRQSLYLGRLTVALIGAANIPLLYLVGKRLWNRRVGLLAAAILAFNGYHVANCHWMKNDIIATFFLTAAFLFIVRIFLRGKTSDYIFAAIFSAAAINAKSYTVPILASCLFAHLGTLPRLTIKGIFRRLIDRKLILFVLVFLVIFVATYPLLYLDFDYIVDNFQKMADKTETDAMFGGLGNKARPRTFLQIRGDNICNFARFSWEMGAGMGGYVLLLGIGGIITAFWTRKKRLLLLISFPVIYLIAAVLVASPGVRYQDVIPLIPFFALLAAVFIQFIFQTVFKKQWLVTGAVLASGMILLIPYLRMVIRMDYGYWERSVRYYATRWAGRNIPPGSAVIRESKTLSLNGSRYRSARVRALWDRNVEILKASGVDYLVVAERHERRALEETGLFGPEHPYGKFYLTLPSEYDLIKQFSIGEIPYRGGGSKIWQLRKEYPITPGGINSALLRRIQNDFSFSSLDIIFPDQGGRCEGTTGFIVPPDEQLGRLIISPVPIPRLGIQVLHGDKSGKIRIRSSSDKMLEEFGPDQVRQFVVSPRDGFPFIDYSYRISISSAWNSPSLVRLQTDPYRIGLGYFEIKEYREAIPFLEEARRIFPDDWYPRILLAFSYSMLGSREKAEFYRAEVERLFPDYRSALGILGDDDLSSARWAEEFKNLTGLNPEWISQRAGQSWYKDELMYEPGMRRIEIKEFYLPKGDYRIWLRRSSSGKINKFGLLSARLRRDGADLLQWDLPEGEGTADYELKNRNMSNKYTLIIEGEKESFSGLNEILIYPTVDSIRSRVSEYFKEIKSNQTAKAGR